MSKKVKIATVDTKPKCAAHQNIPGRSTRTVLFIDPVARRALVRQEGKTDSMLMSTYHNRTHEFAIDRWPDEEEIKEYLEDGLGQDLLQKICDGYDEEWDGNNMIGTLSQEAHMALYELYDYLNECEDKYTFWEAARWLDPVIHELDALTTTAELKRKAEEWSDEASMADPIVIVDQDIYEYIKDHRDQLRDRYHLSEEQMQAMYFARRCDMDPNFASGEDAAVARAEPLYDRYGEIEPESLAESMRLNREEYIRGKKMLKAFTMKPSHKAPIGVAIKEEEAVNLLNVPAGYIAGSEQRCLMIFKWRD